MLSVVVLMFGLYNMAAYYWMIRYCSKNQCGTHPHGWTNVLMMIVVNVLIGASLIADDLIPMAYRDASIVIIVFYFIYLVATSLLLTKWWLKHKQLTP